MGSRREKDAMGEFEVPGDALYGAQTSRAVENFSISGVGIGREMIRALGLVKRAAALVNVEMGLIDSRLGEAVAVARPVVVAAWFGTTIMFLIFGLLVASGGWRPNETRYLTVLLIFDLAPAAILVELLRTA